MSYDRCLHVPEKVPPLVVAEEEGLYLGSGGASVVAVLPHAVIPSHQKHGVVGTLLEYFGEVLRKLPNFNIHHGIGKRGGRMADMVNPQKMSHNEVHVRFIFIPAEVLVKIIVDDPVASVEIMNVKGVGANS